MATEQIMEALKEQRAFALQSLQIARDVPQMTISIAGVGFNIYFQNDDGETSRYFQEYMSEFLGGDKTEIFYEIFYFIAEDEFASPLHDMWNTPGQIFIKKDLSETEMIVNQRDFISFNKNGGKTVVAQGPRLYRGVTDTIDNLITSTIIRFLPQVNALPLHAACVEKDGKAHVFFGASGAGKSTLALQAYNLDGLNVLSGDQIYLRIEGDKLYACPCSTSIAGFDRDHPGRCSKTLEVSSLIHLKRGGGFKFQVVKSSELLQLFLRETIYWSNYGNGELLLDLASKMVYNLSCTKGEMSYVLGESFWKDLPI